MNSRIMLRFVDKTFELLRSNANGDYRFIYIEERLGDRDVSTDSCPSRNAIQFNHV